MSNTLKLSIYVILLILAGISGFFAISQWKSVMDRPRGDSDLERIEAEPVRAPGTGETAASEAGTNTVTNLAGTNAVSAVAEVGTNGLAQAVETNAPPVEAKTAEAEEENLEDVDVSVPTALGGRAGTEDKPGRMGLWSAVFLLSILALAILIGLDVAHYFGNRTLDVLYNDEGHGVGDRDYEAAEQVWANGDHLEAIRMMREYLEKNPREQFVALRIAEIYEKDLGNHLAAALEYEEVLKHKLQPDRWGWAAIHLCNLYFKLNQEEKAYALLRRIVQEYPETPAAEKARKRLAEVGEPEVQPEIPTESQVNAEPEQPKSNLPPGFRPKK